MKATNSVRGAVRCVLLTSVAAAALPVYAQDASIQEVVVTGTRIHRPDFEGTSPVISVSQDALKTSGTVTVETMLNTLPQVVPSLASSSNNPPGQGEARIDLRGLGTQRNIILVDGIRMTPANSSGVVDVNTIPTPLIERVEVISGGASAVYGADAVSGAINFILRDDFEGVELSSQYGLTEQGDGEVLDGSMVIGGNFEQGGNAVVYVNYSSRQAVNKGDRDFTSQADSLTSFFPMGAYFGGPNQPSQAALNQVFTGYGVAAGGVSRGNTLGFNDDGTLFSVGDGTASLVQNFRDPIDIDVASAFFPERYSFNFEPLNKLILPLERTSLGGLISYPIGAGAEAYSRILFTNYNAQSSLAPSPSPTGPNFTNPAAGAFFTIPVTNPFIPTDLATLLASRSGDNAGLPGAGATEDFLYRKRFVELGPRVESYEKDIFQGVLGLRGDLPNDWRWDVYYANGRFNSQINQDGNVRVSAVEQLLDAPDGGASLCAGGLNPFGNENTMSPECRAFVGVLAKSTERLEQNLAEATLSGNLFELPAGQVGFALGAFYNKLSYTFLPDDVLASGDVAGFNAQDSVIGEVDNTDVFVEFLVPILSEAPLARRLDLTLGYRYSDHSNAGGNSSYKAELGWEPVDTLRFRGGFQRAVRAPNIGELFQPQFENNPQVEDPCNFDSAVRTGTDADAARALCLAQGVPASIVDTYSQTTGQIDALSGGNPNLEEEQADTITFGAVWSSNSSNRYLERLQASVDFYQIEITGAIASISAETTASRCFNADGANPTFSPDNSYCSLFGRDSIGQISDLLETQENLAGINTNGVDVQIDWVFPLGGRAGDLGINLVATWVKKWELQEVPGDPLLDYVGTLGGEIGEAYPEYKGTLSLRHQIADFTTTLRTRYIDAMSHNTCVGDSDPACHLANTGVEETFYLDLSEQWKVTDALTVRAGIENLLDQDARIYSPSVQARTDPSVYDVLGRKWFVSASVQF